MEISDGNNKKESSLTLLELYEYRSFDLVEVLETKSGVKNGATCHVEIFLPE